MRREVILMKRRVFALVSLLILMLTMTAHAIEPYGAVQMPILSFNGTTANCYVDCKGENSTDTVKATLTLYQGKTYVDSWSGSGKGHALVTGNCTVMEMSRNVQSGNTQNLKSSAAPVRLPAAPASTPGTSQAAAQAGCVYRP